MFCILSERRDKTRLLLMNDQINREGRLPMTSRKGSRLLRDACGKREGKGGFLFETKKTRLKNKLGQAVPTPFLFGRLGFGAESPHIKQHTTRSSCPSSAPRSSLALRRLPALRFVSRKARKDAGSAPLSCKKKERKSRKREEEKKLRPHTFSFSILFSIPRIKDLRSLSPLSLPFKRSTFDL